MSSTSGARTGRSLPGIPAGSPPLATQPLADLIRAAFGHAGGLRADHVMGLFRLWWVLSRDDPDQGTYVRYRHEAMVGVLTGEAARAVALAIGRTSARSRTGSATTWPPHGVLGTSMLWFERAPGRPSPAARAVAPPLPGHGRHARRPAGGRVRHRRAGHAPGRISGCSPATWPPSAPPPPRPAGLAGRPRPGRAGGGGGRARGRTRRSSPSRSTRYLARTPAALVGVSLADAVGERRPQNLPGTTTQYPNWCVPLGDGDGRPVLLEDLAAHPGVRAVAAGGQPASAVALLAAQRPLEAVPALDEQAAQRRGRAGRGDQVVGRLDHRAAVAPSGRRWPRTTGPCRGSSPARCRRPPRSSAADRARAARRWSGSAKPASTARNTALGSVPLTICCQAASLAAGSGSPPGRPPRGGRSRVGGIPRQLGLDLRLPGRAAADQPAAAAATAARCPR